MKSLVVLLVSLTTFGTLHADSIQNGSFEQASEGLPDKWRPIHWYGPAKLALSDIARDGRSSALVEIGTEPADASWSLRIPVDAMTRYRIEAWVRTEDVKLAGGTGALINLYGRAERSKAVTGTSDWTNLSIEFNSGWDEVVQLNCVLGCFGLATGRAWFDDISMTKLESKEIKLPSIVVDLNQRREPIPKLIYSQFIEHMGRCIYGGIWAELFEDRKFFDSIDGDGSTWRTFGDGVKTSMSSDDAHRFAGRHSPVLKATSDSGAGGIEQMGIGVRKEKTYDGYVWLKELKALRSPVTIKLLDSATGQVIATTEIQVGRAERFAKLTFSLKPTVDCDDATLQLVLQDGGAIVIGCVSLMPSDNIGGMRADTLTLLKELNAPAYRWPGGNFVSGYDWRDGIGDRDRRPPRKNPAWTGIEHNDFGMHEFIRFCREIDAEPVIAVNTGFGDAYSCAAQLEYANGSTDTPMGKRRAKNGDSEPWKVRQWCIGNEMWGDWQLGYMKREHYELKQNWVVDVMRRVDPDIHEIASGNMGDWSNGMMRNCADHMDAISEHFYCQERMGLLAHARQMTTSIRDRAAFHRELRRKVPDLRKRDIRIAMDEWNYWYGPHVYGELGTRYFLKDALGIAAGLHEFVRHTDIIESAFYAQTVNVIGCIKTTDTDAAFATTGLVLKLYREHFVGVPVATEAGDPIEAQAAISPDRKTLVLSVVNLIGRDIKIPISVLGGELEGGGRVLRIVGDSPMDFNEPGRDPRVTIREEALAKVGKGLSLPRHSISLYLLDLP